MAIRRGGGGGLKTRSVLFLHGSNDLYGASRVLLADAGSVVELGYRVRVILPGDGPLTHLLNAAGVGVEIRPLRVLRRVQPHSALAWPFVLPAKIDRGEVVVLWTLALLNYLPTLRARRVPVVVSVHELIPGMVGSALARLAGMYGNGRGSSPSPVVPIMANSQATGDWLANHGVRRASVVYPAAPPYSPLRRGGVGGPLRVLLAGRVSGWKGHVEALDAVAKLRQGGVDVELTLVGGPFPGQDLQLHRLLDRLRTAPFARYIGEVPDITPLLVDHDVLLVASVRPEPFGLVALEAWAAGRRVVAPDEGGVAEAARMVHGLVFRPRDVGAMAAALETVACQPRLREPPGPRAPAAHLCTQARRSEFWSKVLGGGIGEKVDSAPTPWP
jgi:glycosyltransferase involved in cell wall biosynthesis